MGNIILISGGVSKNSRTARVLQRIASTIEERGETTKTYAVTDFQANDILFANFGSTDIQEFIKSVEQASGVIIATPVYKATYTGALKALLDLLPINIFKGKVILPLAVGGTLHHVLSIEYGLKPLIGVLGGEYVVNGTFVLDSYVQEDGTISDTYTSERIDSSLQDLLSYTNKPIASSI